VASDDEAEAAGEAGRLMSTPSTYPPHLACLSCDPAAVFFTLLHLQKHLLDQHPEQVGQPGEEIKMPKRIQRNNGSGLPKTTVWVGPTSQWSNPFLPGVDATDQVDAVRRFRWLLGERAEYVTVVRHLLGGRDLACSCPLDAVCHADELLRVAAEVPS
jgi:hypothetical protein